MEVRRTGVRAALLSPQFFLDLTVNFVVRFKSLCGCPGRSPCEAR